MSLQIGNGFQQAYDKYYSRDYVNIYVNFNFAFQFPMMKNKLSDCKKVRFNLDKLEIIPTLAAEDTNDELSTEISKLLS